MLFQCWSSAVGGGPIVKQHRVKSSRLLGSTQVSVCTHPFPTIIFSPADQGTFSRTAGQSQAYYNTWNWERGTYDVNHLHILPCEVAVSRVGSVNQCMLQLINNYWNKLEFHLVKNAQTLFVVRFSYQRVGTNSALNYFFRTAFQRVTRSQMIGNIFFFKMRPRNIIVMKVRRTLFSRPLWKYSPPTKAKHVNELF